MPKYHITKKGNPEVCKAKIKCRLGDIEEDHYDSKEKAREAFENKMKKKVQEIEEKHKGPLGVIPEMHRETPTDAFINNSNEVDPEAIELLTDYVYWNSQKSGSAFPPVQLEDGSFVTREEILAAKALDKLQKTSYGENYEGGSMNVKWVLQSTVAQQIPYERMPEVNISEADSPEFNDASTVRLEKKFSKEDDARYLRESTDLIKRLTPQEQNALSYWTGADSTVAATEIYGEANPWGIQTTDPFEEDYFDGKNYIKTIDRVLEKSELKEKKIVYRGLHNAGMDYSDPVVKELQKERFKNPDERLVTKEWVKKTYPIGEEVSFEMPASTTEDSRRAQNFTDSNIICEIKIHKGAAVGTVGAYGLLEREYLIPRKNKYRVSDVLESVPYKWTTTSGEEKTKLMTVIQLEQL